MTKPPKRETSPRFTENPREVIARAPLVAYLPNPASERIPTPAVNPKQVKHIKAGKRTYTFRVRGGVCGGSASHLGTVPQAFFR